MTTDNDVHKMTEARKVQMKALEQKATAGPWRQGFLLTFNVFTEVMGLVARCDGDQHTDADAAFIAAARSFVPDALVEIERLEGEKAMAITQRDRAERIEADLRGQLAARDAEVARLDADLRNVEAISLGRRKVLIDQAHDFANEWKHAEKAEAEVARLTEERDDYKAGAAVEAKAADEARAALATLRGKVSQHLAYIHKHASVPSAGQSLHEKGISRGFEMVHANAQFLGLHDTEVAVPRCGTCKHFRPTETNNGDIEYIAFCKHWNKHVPEDGSGFCYQHGLPDTEDK